MSRTLHLHPVAKSDIQHYFLFILNESEEAAFRFLSAAESTMQRLADWPGTGHPRSAINPKLEGIRAIPIEGFRNHLIFYRVAEDGVHVLRIRHGAMDADAIDMDG